MRHRRPAKAEESITKAAGQWLVDLREAKPYAAGHVPGSVNIALRGRLETWVGTMVPWKAPLVLIGSEAELKEAVFRLHRVAYEGLVLPFEAWTKAGLPVATSGTITPAELYQQMQDGNAPIIVDVRMPYEWMAMRIGTVVNLPDHPPGRAVRQTRSEPARGGGVQQRLPVEPGGGHPAAEGIQERGQPGRWQRGVD